MGTVSEHYELAIKLKRLSGGPSLNPIGDPDWSVVTLFYAALHVTSAYLVATGVALPSSHTSMMSAIRSHPDIDERFLKAYRSLQQFSWNVRYNPTYCLVANQKWQAFDRFRVVRTHTEKPVRLCMGLDELVSQLA
jgi:hypothetical protein